ncbi:MAG TPA: ester cyclase [Acidimicrobiales bacterium]|nr:ester cyclase [Acidimicrobiales bacterium]
MGQALAVEERIAISREYIDVVFNNHHPERALEYVTPDVVWHGNSLGTVSGVDGLTGLLKSFIGALPDLYAEEQDVIASNDLVVVRLVVSATVKDSLLGISADGSKVKWNAIDIYRVTDDGKISEEWAADDLATLGSQIEAFKLPWAP